MKSIEKFLNYSIALVVIAIAASFFLFKNPGKSTPLAKKPKVTDQEVDQVVNKYMQQAVEQNKINQWRTEKALLEARMKVEKDIEKMRRKQEEEAMNVPAERQIWTEAEMARIAAAKNESLQPVPAPQSRANARKTEEFNPSSMTPEEKKEYARQYIENARRGGFLIELDENLEVIKATPIRKPTQQDDSLESINTD